MESLAHWDYAVQFSGYEAAALILGIDPGIPESPKSHESPVCALYQRMALHYAHALKRHFYEALNSYPSEAEAHEMESCRPYELVSQALISKRYAAELDLEDMTFVEWLNDSQQTNFGIQTFSNDVIAKWLLANDLDSVYPFNRDDNSVVRKNHWPWGNYSTQMLGHLEAAVREHWLTYNPANSKTAPKNEIVIDWLMKERKIRRSKAEAIASILRADGLPTGPRK